MKGWQKKKEIRGNNTKAVGFSQFAEGRGGGEQLPIWPTRRVQKWKPLPGGKNKIIM